MTEVQLRELERHVNPPEASSSPRDASLGRFYFLPEAIETAPGMGIPHTFDVDAVRRDFPILQSHVNGKPLVWLDNAATTQKPRAVIQALGQFFAEYNSNVHRGAHALARQATEAYEGAREKTRRFLGAASTREIVFVRGATEAINLVAQTYGRKHVEPGDEVLVTELEHHSNIVPWQLLCEAKGAMVRAIPINHRGEVLMDEYERLLGPRTKIVALAHVSNALGTVLPVELMTAMAHRCGARVLLDGAQAVAHFPVNLQALDCDFYALSGHKLLGPTGIGVLFGKLSLLEEMPPWQGGGSMIDNVSFRKTTFAQAPYKFEAGTGNIGGAIGLGAAIDYLNSIGLAEASAYEDDLMGYASRALTRIEGLRLIGTAAHKVSVLSFVLDGIPTEEIGRFLDQQGIAVRAGHHCAQPSLAHFNLASTVRPSLAFYNTREEVDLLAAAIGKIPRKAD